MSLLLRKIPGPGQAKLLLNGKQVGETHFSNLAGSPVRSTSRWILAAAPDRPSAPPMRHPIPIQAGSRA